VHDLVQEHVDNVQKRVSELLRMVKALERLKEKCQNGTLLDCPAIDELMA